MPRRRRPPRSGALAELPPLKILSQLAALQGTYYAASLVLMFFSALVMGNNFSLDLVFGWQAVRGDNTQGWLVGFIWLLVGGLIMPLAITALIARSKLVLDFALSVHFIHLVVVTLYTDSSIPSNTAWWLFMGASSFLSVSLGTWGCRYRELKPMYSFGGGGGGGGGTSNPNNNAGGGGGAGDNGARRNSNENAPLMQGDEEQGFFSSPSRGRGRGRGRAGSGSGAAAAGEYEMTKMNGAASGGGGGGGGGGGDAGTGR